MAPSLSSFVTPHIPEVLLFFFHDVFALCLAYIYQASTPASSLKANAVYMLTLAAYVCSPTKLESLKLFDELSMLPCDMIALTLKSSGSSGRLFGTTHGHKCTTAGGACHFALVSRDARRIVHQLSTSHATHFSVDLSAFDEVAHLPLSVVNHAKVS